jgi:nucleoid-associated protein YgaU
VAAVAYPMADPWVTARPARPGAADYRRRRAVALMVVVAAVLVAAAALRFALAGLGGGALTTAGPSGAASTPPPGVASHVYVVQPGDTLWSIVHRSGGRGDPRPEVDRLALQLQGRSLQVGQRLHLP